MLGGMPAGAGGASEPAGAGGASEPAGALDWNFSQVFGERTPGEEVQEGGAAAPPAHSAPSHAPVPYPRPPTSQFSRVDPVRRLF